MSAPAPSRAAPSGRAHRGRRLLDDVPNPHPLGQQLPSPFQCVLSPEERSAVEGLASGMPFDELAEELDVSLAMLGKRVDAAVAKLGAGTLEEAQEQARADDFVLRLCVALDGVLAPIFVVLDNIDAYFDPELAPADFLDFLAAWVGVEGPLARSAVARRALVQEAVQVLRGLGTLRGLQHVLELYTGAEVEATDNGKSWSSRDPRALLEGVFDDTPPSVDVKVRGRPSGADDRRFAAAVETITKAWSPAHVITTVEVTA
jgi:phage tail-like protein